MCVCSVCVFEQKVEEEVVLQKGSTVRVLTAESDTDKTDGKVIWVDYPSLPKVVREGGTIYIDDGLIGLKVTEIGEEAQSLICVLKYHLLTNCFNFFFTFDFLCYIILYDYSFSSPCYLYEVLHNDPPCLSLWRKSFSLKQTLLSWMTHSWFPRSRPALCIMSCEMKWFSNYIDFFKCNLEFSQLTHFPEKLLFFVLTSGSYLILDS